MKNLKRLIEQSDLSKQEFGKKMFSNRPSKTLKEKRAINTYVDRLGNKKQQSKVERVCEILKTNPNKLFGYEES